METKKQYTAPQLTVVMVKSESGYATSLLTKLSFWDVNTLLSTQQVEVYTQHEDWTASGGFWD